ncbi:MAG: phenylacetate--CoA ligase family protein, partial [Dehalococcoidia bacterium]|nr:phenylacetate--CoA ligase family protein [Dehalococcoidia bacterium]
MDLYRWTTRHMFAPAYDLIRGTHTMRHLSQLEETQWWPRERIRELQSSRLRRLMHHVYERVPYYREVMDQRGIRPEDITSPSDLPRMPMLTKDLVRSHTKTLLANDFPRSQLLDGSTGGSTGTPLCFYASRQGRWTYGYGRTLRAMQWAGVFPGDRTVSVTKRRLPGSESESVMERLSHHLSRGVFIDCSRFSDQSLPDVVRRIEASHARALRGYVSAICILADYISRSGKPAPDVDAVVVGGEQLFDEQRELLQRVFGRQPFSRYSSFENFEIAMECEAHYGMHVNAEDLIVEIVDDEGRPLPPGVRGHLLVTNLHEFGMPLVRYDTDDESSWSEQPCSCRRQLPLINA